MENKIVAIVAILVTIMGAGIVSIVSADGTTVSIGSATVGEDETAVVSIMIEDVEDAKAASIILNYDKDVVHVTDIGDTQFSMETHKKIDNTTGQAEYAVVQLIGSLSGNVRLANVTLKAVGEAGDFSYLNITVLSLQNSSYQEIPRDVRNGMFTISETTAPIVVNPLAKPYIIPDDTDGVPLWGENTTLSVNVTDESEIASVTVNLSAIGGSPIATMSNIGNYSDGALWCLFNYTTNASSGTAGWNGSAYVPYQLGINASDIYGNSNTSVYIELIVAKNGDVTYDGDVNLGDAIYLINYALHVPGYGIPTERMVLADVDGSGEVNLGDGIYLANYALHVPGYGVLH